MVKGLDIFKQYFRGYEDQYVLIGGAACDIIFSNNDAQFRATRDLDMVLIIEALTPEFANQFLRFVSDADYRHRVASTGESQFYRFDKPETEGFPKMIELFSRKSFELKKLNGLTPIYINDEVSSLSAILLDDNYYQILLDGKIIEQGLSVLRPEYLIIFKAKACLDLKVRKERGEQIDSSNIKKHKNDILRIAVEMVLERPVNLPASITNDIEQFLQSLYQDPFDANLLKGYGLKSEELVKRMIEIYRG
ncbi:hypothetical protein HNQ56_001443 [Anaerotaenia torta]|uniref:hypothetical protein n=1 Tax=Anaerotaenia torta TaxID=433293 RepID=UPI003D2051ED